MFDFINFNYCLTNVCLVWVGCEQHVLLTGTTKDWESCGMLKRLSRLPTPLCVFWHQFQEVFLNPCSNILYTICVSQFVCKWLRTVFVNVLHSIVDFHFSVKGLLSALQEFFLYWVKKLIHLTWLVTMSRVSCCMKNSVLLSRQRPGTASRSKFSASGLRSSRSASLSAPGHR